MKNSVLISFGLHIVFIIFLLIWRSEPKGWNKASTIYPVELISMTQILNVPNVKKETIEAAQPAKKPEDEAVNVAKADVKKRPEAKKKTSPESIQRPTGAAATGLSNLKIDTEDFPFVYYIKILQNRIQGNWQPPYQASEQQEKMSTLVRFQVLKNGKIANVSLEKSSGRYLYDLAAQRAVYSADPLPPLPDGFNGEFLSVHIEFEGMQ